MNNLKISGYDAEIRMLINEYTTGEWRNCISLYSCSNVQITGVKLSQSGGGGIYLGVSGSQKYSYNVLIKDVSCSGNGRQGISVISAKDLIIENCTFSDTGIYNPTELAPHGPWAGIDFEMNNDDERFENIIVRDCNFINNRRYDSFSS